MLDSRLRTLGPDNTDTLLTRYNLGLTLFDEKHYAEADTLLRSTLAAQRRVLDQDDPDTLASEAQLAHVLVYEGKPQQAERLARLAYIVQAKKLGLDHDDTRQTLGYLGEALVRLGRYDEARNLYLATIDRIAASPSDWWYDLAGVAALCGHKDEAFTYLSHAVQAGFDSANSMRADENMKILRHDPRFQQALSGAQRNLAAQAAGGV